MRNKENVVNHFINSTSCYGNALLLATRELSTLLADVGVEFVWQLVDKLVDVGVLGRGKDLDKGKVYFFFKLKKCSLPLRRCSQACRSGCSP